jgi:hypothetical protein
LVQQSEGGADVRQTSSPRSDRRSRRRNAGAFAIAGRGEERLQARLSGFLFAAFAAIGFSGFSLYGMFAAITGAIVVPWVHPAPAIV